MARRQREDVLRIFQALGPERAGDRERWKLISAVIELIERHAMARDITLYRIVTVNE